MSSGPPRVRGRRSRSARARNSNAPLFRGDDNHVKLVIDNKFKLTRACTAPDCSRHSPHSGQVLKDGKKLRYPFCPDHAGMKICENEFCPNGNGVEQVNSTGDRWRYEHFFCAACTALLDDVVEAPPSHCSQVVYRMRIDRLRTSNARHRTRPTRTRRKQARERKAEKE